METRGTAFIEPVKLSARDKAAVTDHAARAIIDAESRARQRKTEKLKSLRLEQAAREERLEAPPKTKRVKPGRQAAGGA